MSVIMISNARLSFPALVEPKGFDGGPAAYNADLILAPNDPGFQEFMRVISQLAQEKWKEHANAVLQLIQTDRKLRAFGNGSEKIDKKTFKPYNGYEGMMYISALNKVRPQFFNAQGAVIDPSNTMALQQEARRMYGGCRVNAAIKPWLQDNKFGRGVRCELVAIQFAKDDTPFGDSTPDVTNLFGQVAAPTAGFSPAGAPAAPAFPSFLTGQ